LKHMLTNLILTGESLKSLQKEAVANSQKFSLDRLHAYFENNEAV